MQLPLITAQPATEPVTLDEMKVFARVDYEDDDDLLTSLMKSARVKVERWLGRALITQTRAFMLSDSGFESAGKIILPNPNVQSISSVTYYDTSEASQTVSSALYRLVNGSDPDNEAFIELLVNQTWPTATANRELPWTVTYVCGYGTDAANVPEEIKLGIKMLVATWYEHRELIVVGTTAENMPFSTHGVLMAHRWNWAV
jgi:uncharacterized phiE125 gp8 family phage protein